MAYYTQLAMHERYTIHRMRKADYKQNAIAKAIGRSPSTVSRELARNTGGRGYRPHQAQRLALARRNRPARVRISREAWIMAESLLRSNWSPEQIGPRLKLMGHVSICHERIYQHVYRNAAEGGTLWRHLRRSIRRRRRRCPGRGRRGVIRNRRLIDARPALVGQRARVGDWEADLIVGKGNKGYVLTMVERVTQALLMARCRSKRAKDVGRAMKAVLKRIPKRFRKTLTVDNGHEFAGHENVSKATGVKIFFAHPYHSWERGTNENTNGLVRQYLPRSIRLDKLCPQQLAIIEGCLNTRPRKSLGFGTPTEAMILASSLASNTGRMEIREIFADSISRGCLPKAIQERLSPIALDT